MNERILCAAIWFDDGKEYVHQPKNIKTGMVVCGRRHHNCFSIIADILGKVGERRDLGLHEKEQGFLTSTDRFVTREEAAEIALRENQVKPEELAEVLKSKFLYSENLY